MTATALPVGILCISVTWSPLRVRIAVPRISDPMLLYAEYPSTSILSGVMTSWSKMMSKSCVLMKSVNMVLRVAVCIPLIFMVAILSTFIVYSGNGLREGWYNYGSLPLCVARLDPLLARSCACVGGFSIFNFFDLLGLVPVLCVSIAPSACCPSAPCSWSGGSLSPPAPISAVCGMPHFLSFDPSRTGVSVVKVLGSAGGGTPFP